MNCLIKNCTRRATLRGLCNSCYQCARRLVVDKKTTWEELEKKKMAFIKKRTRRSEGNFMIQFNKLNGK